MYPKSISLLVFAGISIIYVLLSLTIYKDLGITADEELEYKSGKALVYYLMNGLNPDSSGLNARHLPTYSTYSRVYPAILVLLNQKGYYEWYHLLNLLFGYSIFATIFLFFHLEYKKLIYTLIPIVFLITTPRIIGDLPTNPKDIPFAIVFLISIFLIYLFFKNTNRMLLKVFLISLIFGLGQSMRTVGLSLQIVLAIYLFRQYIAKCTGFTISLIIKTLIATLILSIFFMGIFLPYVKYNFPYNFVSLFHNASAFEYWDNFVFFNGEFFKKSERPFIYLPVWITISTPLHILIPTIISFFIYFFNTKLKNLYLLLHSSLFISFTAYFMINPVIYNGPRHFLYLILIMCVLASLVVNDFYILFSKNKVIKIITSIILISYLIHTTITVFKLHPYQYIYFNEILGGLGGAYNNFEMDYWGASYKESTDYLVNNILQENTKVYPCNLSYAVLYYSKGKFKIANSVQEADYTMCTYEEDLYENLNSPVVYTVTRENVPINIIRKIK